MNDDSQLRDLLRASLPEAEVPTRFNAEVWQRIQARSAASANRWWVRWFESVPVLFARPAFAAVVLLVSVGAAAGAATFQAAEMNARGRSELALRHIAALDPYVHLAAKR
jgi:hypothetical protein